MNAACSLTLARMEGPAAILLAAMFVCVSMAGVGLTALRTLMTAPQQRATKAPHASTVLHHFSVCALPERQVWQL